MKSWDTAVRILVALGLVVAVVLAVFSVVPLAELSAPVAALIAGMVALSINETVGQRRRYELEKDAASRKAEQEKLQQAQRHELDAEKRAKALENAAALRAERADAYEQIIVQALSSFQGGSPLPETFVRARVLLVGSDEFVAAFKRWKSAIAPFAGQGVVTIPHEARGELHESVAGLVRAAKIDLELSADKLMIADIASILFDDYSHAPDRAGDVRGTMGSGEGLA